MAYQRDPVSQSWDRAAVRMLTRAQAADSWVPTVLANPTRTQVTRWRRAGIDVNGKDNAPGGAARSRWCRGFVRAINYWAKASGVRVEVTVGRRVPALGNVHPAGRACRVRVVRKTPDGARRYMAAVPDTDKAYTDDGQKAGRWADPEQRDW